MTPEQTAAVQAVLHALDKEDDAKMAFEMRACETQFRVAFRDVVIPE